MPHEITDQMRECVDRCHSCEEICVESVTYCLALGGPHAEPDHIGLLVACAEICDTSARFMLLGSDHYTHTCGLCADVCESCAKHCARFEDDLMQRCADICRRCAEACRKIAVAVR